MSELQPYQQRVLEESVQLSERAVKLGTFINSPAFDQLDKYEQRRLLVQSVHMLHYLEVLRQRIEAF